MCKNSKVIIIRTSRIGANVGEKLWTETDTVRH